jgi:formate transporter
MLTRSVFFCCLIVASQAFAVTQHHPHPHAAYAAKSTVALPMFAGGSGQAPVSALRAPPALYDGAVAAGTAKANASFAKIFKLGIVAGCHIGFGVYLALTVGGACPGIAAENPGLQKFIMSAIGLPTGLLMALVTGAELFTGNTALVSAAYMEGKVTKQAVAKNFIASYIGNFVGSVLLAYLAYKSGTLGAGPAAVDIATAKCAMPWDVAFVRGILGNWLVCMAVYMASGCSTMIGKMST